MASKRVMGLSFAASFVLMIAAPFVAVKVINGEGGFAFMLMQFLWINPIMAAINGAVAGRNLKENWSIIFFPSALFLLSARLIFSAAMSEFFFYAIMYLAVGAVTMLISYLMANSSRKKKDAEPESQNPSSEN